MLFEWTQLFPGGGGGGEKDSAICSAEHFDQYKSIGMNVNILCYLW